MSMSLRSAVNRKHRTRVRLWLAISVVLFFLEWLLPSGAGKGAGYTYEPVGRLFFIFLTGAWPWQVKIAMLGVLSFCSAVFAVAAGVFGWVIHAVVAICWDAVHEHQQVGE